MERDINTVIWGIQFIACTVKDPQVFLTLFRGMMMGYNWLEESVKSGLAAAVGTVHYSEPGLISEHGVYVVFIGHYMYTGDTVEQLLLKVRDEWQDDKHYVGN